MEYFENSKRKIHINPCLNCGSDNIELRDCGYSSFNPGGGKCLNCGRDISGEAGCNPSKKDLAKIWNESNDIAKTLASINKQIASLTDQRERLEKNGRLQ